MNFKVFPYFLSLFHILTLSEKSGYFLHRNRLEGIFFFNFGVVSLFVCCGSLTSGELFRVRKYLDMYGKFQFNVLHNFHK